MKPRRVATIFNPWSLFCSSETYILVHHNWVSSAQWLKSQIRIKLSFVFPLVTSSHPNDVLSLTSICFCCYWLQTWPKIPTNSVDSTKRKNVQNRNEENSNSSRQRLRIAGVASEWRYVLSLEMVRFAPLDVTCDFLVNPRGPCFRDIRCRKGLVPVEKKLDQNWLCVLCKDWKFPRFFFNLNRR